MILVFIVGCQNLPDDVKELKELTKDMTKEQKAKTICEYYNDSYNGEIIRDCEITKIDPLDCRKYTLLCIFGIDGFIGGDITYHNEKGTIIGRCDKSANGCIYLAEDFEHYKI